MKKKKKQKLFMIILFCCEETAVLSLLQIPLYQQNGTLKLLNYCVTCAYDLFKTEVESMFDQEEDKPKMNLLCENTNPVKFIDLLDSCDNNE